jgi:hypothetical protein
MRAPTPGNVSPDAGGRFGAALLLGCGCGDGVAVIDSGTGVGAITGRERLSAADAAVDVGSNLSGGAGFEPLLGLPTAFAESVDGETPQPPMAAATTRAATISAHRGVCQRNNQTPAAAKQDGNVSCFSQFAIVQLCSLL